jgi:hypothetical protein
LRYRGAAMAEFWRALRTLRRSRPEQAEAAAQPAGAAQVLEASPKRPPLPPAPVEPSPAPKEPERRLIDRYATPVHAVPGRSLHETAAPWLPKEPEAGRHAASAPALRDIAPERTRKRN